MVRWRRGSLRVARLATVGLQCAMGRGRGRGVRRLAESVAGVCDATGTFILTNRTIQYASWFALVTPDRMADPENPTTLIHAFTDPLYQTPFVVATDRRLSAETCYRIYRDRCLLRGYVSLLHKPRQLIENINLYLA